MSRCRVCDNGRIALSLDFGRQPFSNRFVSSPSDSEETYELAQGICDACGTVQLTKGPAASDCRARFDWLTQSEPEGHLDRVVSLVTALPGVNAQSSIGGISFKDDSTLRRFNDRGFPKTWRLSLREDAGVTEPLAGIETIQSVVDEKTARYIVSRTGPFDIVIARHILEHAEDLKRFAGGLKALVADNGYIVFEIPDEERALALGDYSLVWEEHFLYFTPDTLRAALAALGFELAAFHSFPYEHENSMVAIAKKKSGPPSAPALTIRKETDRFANYVNSFSSKRVAVQAYLAQASRDKGGVAMMGAGHLTAAFINLFGLRSLVKFVVDDNQRKQGLLMPGSKCPIVSSERLKAKQVGMCLLGINPENEPKVLAKNRPFVDEGGEFFSIFPESRMALAPLRFHENQTH